MPFAIYPLHNATLIFGEAVADEIFGAAAIGVGGRRRDVGFAAKAFPEIAVASADMLLESVPATSFVSGQVAGASVRTRAIVPGSFLRLRRAGTGAGRRQAER
jgi:hypothetical protein